VRAKEDCLSVSGSIRQSLKDTEDKSTTVKVTDEEPNTEPLNSNQDDSQLLHKSFVSSSVGVFADASPLSK